MRKLILSCLSIFVIVMALALVAFSPPLQGLQRFKEILVTGPANFDGPTDFDSTVDFSGATVDDLTLGDDLAVAGTADVAGSLQYGPGDLYPLGYATDAQQISCGTALLTGTLQITPTGLSTVTYAIATQITDPASTGALLSVSDPTTTTFTILSWEADYTEGTTGVSVHWCAVGDQ